MPTLIRIAFALLAAMVSMAAPPRTGEKAPDFTLSSLEGERVQLSTVAQQGSVVLVVLRGFPGYQCPLCNRQARDFINNAAKFADAKAQVVLVYPGPRDVLAGKAEEFLSDKQLPAHFTFVLDPEYEMTNRYSLRWDAPKETAYPSTFVLDSNGMIVWSKVSDSHGGRSSAAEVLEALAKLK